VSNNSQPLVSIIMPCYNGRETLPMALASLLCQTYQNWECVFIDDGSSDGSADIVKSIGDPRFRIIKFNENRGRGAARQRGNEEARGEYIAMLDADDWYYSTKLEKQIVFLSINPDISLVSTGMIIADEEGYPVGYRGRRQIIGETLDTLKDPPLAYAPTCIKADVAKNYPYNPLYRRAQDKDFLQRVCMREKFANLPELLYVYREYRSYNWVNVKQSFVYRIKSLCSLTKEFPFRSRLEMIKVWSKLFIYASAFAFGQGRRLVARRSAKLAEEMQNIYDKEKQGVEAVAAKIF
jgi:glycosyltransferase involved in cell wall biosynthesis